MVLLGDPLPDQRRRQAAAQLARLYSRHLRVDHSGRRDGCAVGNDPPQRITRTVSPRLQPAQFWSCIAGPVFSRH